MMFASFFASAASTLPSTFHAPQCRYGQLGTGIRASGFRSYPEKVGLTNTIHSHNTTSSSDSNTSYTFKEAHGETERQPQDGPAVQPSLSHVSCEQVTIFVTLYMVQQ